jgi:hypothetical protein
MELSAFAHLSKRNIKVIQPGLVYVIEWQAGESSTTASSSSSKDENLPPEPRRSKRTQRPSVSSPSKHSSNSINENQQIVKIGTGKHGYYVLEEISDSESDNDEEEVEESLNPDVDQDGEAEGETVYVAYVPFFFMCPSRPTVSLRYHDWEHFSSIRNLRGPHAGLPHVKETPPQGVRENEAVREREREREREKEKEKKRKEKERERGKQKTMKVKLKISSPSTSSPTPTSISLGSLSSLSSCSSLTLPSSSISPAILSIPKRTFDESSEEDGGGGGSGSGREEKRSRLGSTGVRGRSRLGFRGGDLDAAADADSSIMDRDGDRDTPGLSAPGSSSEPSSDSFSDLTSPSPPPNNQVEPAPMVVSSPPPHSQQTKSPPKSKPKINSSYSTQGGGGGKQLTRRQRKALGLPKARPPPHLTSSAGVGKIVIPGGKWKGRQSQDTVVGVVVDGDGGGDEEWRRNGTGRVDVRGFRELKI